MKFTDYLKTNGEKNPNQLMAVVEAFLDDPSVFFSYTPKERSDIEARIDAVLELFR